METIQLRSLADANDLLKRATLDLSVLDGIDAIFEKELCEIRIVVKGERFNSTLTPSLMRSILRLQDGLYDLYLSALDEGSSRRMPAGMRKELDFLVEVHQGSSDILIKLGETLDSLKGVLAKMKGSQVTAILIVLIAAVAAKSIADATFDHDLKARSSELEKQRAAADTEAKKQFADLAAKALSIAQDTRTSAIRSLSKEDAATISIDGNQYKPADLGDRVRTERPRLEVIAVPLEGDFKVLSINFEKSEEATFIDVQSTSTSVIYRNINILRDFMSKDDYSLLERAMERNPVRLRLVLNMKRDRVESAILQSIVK